MKKSEKEYTAEELLQYAYKYNQIPVVLFAKDTQARYIYTSEIEDLINGGREHSILGKTDREIQYDPQLGQLFYEQDLEIVRTGNPCHCYSEFVKDGVHKFLEVTKNPFYADDQLLGVCGAASDVTELMHLKAKFEALTFQDALTSVYNRNYFLDHDFEKPSALPCAYLMCDCNHLKKVNDRYGHETGDSYLRTAAALLKDALPKHGICIRWGGDEFLLILPNCEEAQAQDVIQRIDQLQTSYRRSADYFEIAIGFAIRRDLSEPESDVIARADSLMYADKSNRKKAAPWK